MNISYLKKKDNTNYKKQVLDNIKDKLFCISKRIPFLKNKKILIDNKKTQMNYNKTISEFFEYNDDLVILKNFRMKSLNNISNNFIKIDSEYLFSKNIKILGKYGTATEQNIYFTPKKYLSVNSIKNSFKITTKNINKQSDNELDFLILLPLLHCSNYWHFILDNVYQIGFILELFNIDFIQNSDNTGLTNKTKKCKLIYYENNMNTEYITNTNSLDSIIGIDHIYALLNGKENVMYLRKENLLDINSNIIIHGYGNTMINYTNRYDFSYNRILSSYINNRIMKFYKINENNENNENNEKILLYITRNKARNKRISNEKDLHQELFKICNNKKYKLKILDIGGGINEMGATRISVKNQILEINKADIILLEVGAAMANLIFMKKNASVICCVGNTKKSRLESNMYPFLIPLNVNKYFCNCLIEWDNWKNNFKTDIQKITKILYEIM